jgi:hypothetical protein
MSISSDFMNTGAALDGGVVQGVVTQQEVESLNKAISAGYPTGANAAGLVGSGVLQVESLDSTLRAVTFEQKHLQFWPALPTDKAFATVEQYNRLLSYGSNGSPYFGEGGVPNEEDSTYIRDTQKIVYFGTKRRVTHQAMLVRMTTGDAMAQQAKEGTIWMLKNMEVECYWGNAWFSNSGELDGHLAALPQSSIAMNGLQQQLLRGGSDIQQMAGDLLGFGADKKTHKDVAGSVVTADDLEDAGLSILENFGMPDQMHMEPGVHSALSKVFYPKERINTMGVADGKAGYVLKEFVSSAGSFALKSNVFLRPRLGVSATQMPAAGAPIHPMGVVTASSASVPAEVSVSSFIAGDVFQYIVKPVNDAGEGIPSAPVSATVVASGDEIRLVIPAGVVGAKSYMVFRSAAGAPASTAQFIGNVAPMSIGGGVTFVDRNRKLPGLGEAYLLSMSPERIAFKQLSPLSKIDLAVTSASREFLMVLYGALIVFMPRQFYIIRNAGK